MSDVVEDTKKLDWVLVFTSDEDHEHGCYPSLMRRCAAEREMGDDDELIELEEIDTEESYIRLLVTFLEFADKLDQDLPAAINAVLLDSVHYHGVHLGRSKAFRTGGDMFRPTAYVPGGGE